MPLRRLRLAVRLRREYPVARAASGAANDRRSAMLAADRRASRYPNIAAVAIFSRLAVHPRQNHRRQQCDNQAAPPHAGVVGHGEKRPQYPRRYGQIHQSRKNQPQRAPSSLLNPRGASAPPPRPAHPREQLVSGRELAVRQLPRPPPSVPLPFGVILPRRPRPLVPRKLNDLARLGALATRALPGQTRYIQRIKIAAARRYVPIGSDPRRRRRLPSHAPMRRRCPPASSAETPPDARS